MTETEAHALDAADDLPTLRSEFHVPADSAYLAGNSLGLQHRSIRDRLLDELDDWARLGVEGHLEAKRPWLPYHEQLRVPAARLVGARPSEIVMMNSLTVNLHLMMVSFYRPTADRHAIVIEDSSFPSDSYAVRSQAAFHGYDPDAAVIRLESGGDVVNFLAAQGDRVALVLLGGVNYLTGELLDIPTITAAGHAAGNVPLQLHDWDVDWAAWCSYKYLNSGPGAVAGAFVHERHLADRSLPRLEGWWGTRVATRFAMAPVLEPVETADAWQLSNPPILAMAPVLASLEVFDAVGMAALRAKSVRLTGYLASLLDGLDVITPGDPARRGAQLSVRVPDAAAASRR